MNPAYDIAGKTFGRLTVVSFGRATSKGGFWLCRCACGGEKTARADTLASGNTSSCGCAWREAIAASNSVDLTGQRFGKLMAIERAGSKRHSVMWRCSCDCGGEKVAPAGKLGFGSIISCGCVRRSTARPLSSEKSRAQAAADGARRRALKLAASGSFTPEQIDELYQKQRGKCACCSDVLGASFHRDHKIPLTRGGSNDILNIELLCAPCNLAKQDMDPIDWANKRGLLC